MSYSTFITVVMVLQVASGVWLATRGRRVGLFFAAVAGLALVSLP